MTIAAKLRRSARAFGAFLLAVCTSFGVMVATGPAASAGPRDGLRPDATGTCDWDPANHWVQRCDVASPSMGYNITVQIQPAARGGNAGLYLLDGMRANNTSSDWINNADAEKAFLNDNITVVMPVGGAGSFYTNWNGDATLNPLHYVNYQWTTFLTEELPAYLEQNFGVSRSNNAIAGLSMGATAAMNLAANFPQQFRQAASYSGYLTTTLPGVYTLMGLALLDVGGFNIINMYSSMVDPRRFQEDPFLNMGSLRENNQGVYISAGTGIPEPGNIQPPNEIAAGVLLEASALASTRLWEAKARATGVNMITSFPLVGVHNWANWNDQLYRSRDWILDGMGAR